MIARCVWPLPPDRSANRVDTGFLDPEYPKQRARMGLPPDEHPGVDINLSGTSGNKDLGYPVVAILPGEVVHAGHHRVWGNIILIRHDKHIAKGMGYPVLYSQYAHLLHISVREGQRVVEGEPVGSIGKGDPAKPFLAHLHFELRIADLPPDYWPRTRDNILGHYIDPVLFLVRNAQYERRWQVPQVIIYQHGKQSTHTNGIYNTGEPGVLQVRV